MAVKHFLIVDDDVRFARLVSHLLDKFAQCTLAPNGEEALLQFEHHINEKAPFTAVFMDIEMPGMTGHEVVNQMRNIEKKNRIAPLNTFKLIMLTAHTDVKNVSTSFFKGGADAYIRKTDIKDKLVPTLQEIKLV